MLAISINIHSSEHEENSVLLLDGAPPATYIQFTKYKGKLTTSAYDTSQKMQRGHSLIQEGNFFSDYNLKCFGTTQNLSYLSVQLHIPVHTHSHPRWTEFQMSAFTETNVAFPLKNKPE